MDCSPFFDFYLLWKVDFQKRLVTTGTLLALDSLLGTSGAGILSE
jgi:hypothetical protein